MSLKLVWESWDVDGASDTQYPKDEGGRHETDILKVFKKEALVPRTRLIGTWIEGLAANITIELSEEALQLQQATHGLVKNRLLQLGQAFLQPTNVDRQSQIWP